jgi:nicotinate phosphoribosyltransferase
MKQNKISPLIHFTGTYTDNYQLTMAQVYFLKGQKDNLAVFDYFFRKCPFNGGYAVFAGLEDLLGLLEEIHFSQSDIDFLFKQDFNREFLNYLEQFRFKGSVYAAQEGEVVFPICPVLSVEANIIEAQLIETLLLNILNFQTLIATKASRLRQVAGEHRLIDFGLRRAQGVGGYYASRAASIGGVDATSNVRAGRDYDIPLSGTMAHAFVQSYDNELSAFRDFSKVWPDNCFLLVDTYNTLQSGVPNAIKIAKEMEEQNAQRLQGIRLDSGDLAYLAKQARQMLDEAGLHYVKIIASNQLDEWVIKSLLEQSAPIDAFGVGTRLVTGQPDAALDGIYKLAFANNKPSIKLSESINKINLPYKKQVYRVLDSDGSFFGADVITMAEEKNLDIMYHPFDTASSLLIKDYEQESLLHKVMENGKRLFAAKTLREIGLYRQKRLRLLATEYKRFDNAHIYKIGLSKRLKNERDQLVAAYKKRGE